MTEPTPTAPPADGVTPDAPADAPEVKAPTAEDVAKLNVALDKERELRKTYEKSVKDFETQRKAAMTEAERAVAEAEERGRSSVRSEYGQRLARTQFEAEAARRNPDPAETAKALKYLKLADFVGEDGEPDTKAIAAAVADLIPEVSNVPTPPPSFDGGTRQPAQAGVSMSQLIRQAAGRA